MNDTTKPADALEPCPFCGSEAAMQTQYGVDFWAQCMNPECGCTNGKVYQGSSQYAARAWNRRAPKASAVPEYEATFREGVTALVMRHIDRMNDICDEDPAERIIVSFIKGFDPLRDAYWAEKFPGRDIAAAPQAEEAPAVPTVEEFLARLLPPPGYEGHKVIEREGKLMFCKPEDIRPDDGLCFYDGDMRTVAIPECVQPSVANDPEFIQLVDNIGYAYRDAGDTDEEGKTAALVAFFDAKLTQARLEAVRSADNFRQLVSDSDSAEIKEWKTRCFAAEEKLASIQAMLDKE